MGQVYCTRCAGTPVGSSAIPHFGHAPIFSDCTSGCIGHVYSTLFARCVVGRTEAGFPIPRPAIETSAGRVPSYRTGSASNFFKHDWQQKNQLFPSCSVDHFAVASATSIPQIGSLAMLTPASILRTASRRDSYKRRRMPPSISRHPNHHRSALSTRRSSP
jgi:hypothetical protein